MPADLHVHTTCSDGTCPPEEIARLAEKAGLTAVAITDHDVVDGIERAASARLEIIAGIELTAEALNTEIHILGLFIDHHDAELNSVIARIQKGREERIYKICEKLLELDVKIDPESVFQIAGHRAAGRPHVAAALLAAGYVSSFGEAFDKYIDFHGPAYVSHYKLLPEEAVALVLLAKGVPVYAHPRSSNCDQIIPDLMAAGLRGIEVYYSSHNQSQTLRYLNLARKYGLLITGGSDYHGLKSGREVELGEIKIADELLEKVRAAAGR